MIALALLSLSLVELLSSLLEMQRVVFAISTCCVGSFNVLICPIQHVVSFCPFHIPAKNPSLTANRKEKGIDEDDNEDEKIGLRAQEMGIVNGTSTLLA